MYILYNYLYIFIFFGVGIFFKEEVIRINVNSSLNFFGRVLL